MTKHTEPQTDFERRARAAFDASVDSVDAHTRSRLNRARHAATAELERRHRSHWLLWAPAGALAAAALVAVLLWRTPEPAGDASRTASANQATDAAVEVLAADEDIDLASEDLDFYEWVDEQTGSPVNGNG